jgi:hypothetical protein
MTNITNMIEIQDLLHEYQDSREISHENQIKCLAWIGQSIEFGKMNGLALLGGEWSIIQYPNPDNHIRATCSCKEAQIRPV